MLVEKNIRLKNDLNISYLDNGASGKKILFFVHGWGADKYNLKGIYHSLENKFHLIILDLPGFGKSSIPEDIIGSEGYADILVDFLKSINIKNINYIGHSFGGKIGIILSVKYPELIKRLVLIDSSGLKLRRHPDWYIKVWMFKFLKFIFNSWRCFCDNSISSAL